MNIWFVDHFGLRRIHLHFPVMICILSLAFPIFLIPLGYPFAYAEVCHISPFRIICEVHLQALARSPRSLIKTGLSETGGKASFPSRAGDHPPKPAPCPAGCLLLPSTFFHPHDRMGSQDDLPSFMPCLRTLY